MIGCVVPYVNEIGLAGNIASQLQGMYVRSYVLHIGGNMYSTQQHESNALALRAHLDSKQMFLLSLSS